MSKSKGGLFNNIFKQYCIIYVTHAYEPTSIYPVCTIDRQNGNQDDDKIIRILYPIVKRQPYSEVINILKHIMHMRFRLIIFAREIDSLVTSFFFRHYRQRSSSLEEPTWITSYNQSFNLTTFGRCGIALVNCFHSPHFF